METSAAALLRSYRTMSGIRFLLMPMWRILTTGNQHWIKACLGESRKLWNVEFQLCAVLKHQLRFETSGTCWEQTWKQLQDIWESEEYVFDMLSLRMVGKNHPKKVRVSLKLLASTQPMQPPWVVHSQRGQRVVGSSARLLRGPPLLVLLRGFSDAPNVYLRMICAMIKLHGIVYGI